MRAHYKNCVIESKIFMIFKIWFACLLQNTRQAKRKMYHKRLLRHTVTTDIHINVSGQSIFLVLKRNCGYSACEGETADLEAKALVWKRNCGTSSCSILLVRKRNYGTSKHYSLCGSGISDLKVTQYSMCGTGTAELKVSVYS